MKTALLLLVATCLTACSKPGTTEQPVTNGASASSAEASICEYETAVPPGVVGVSHAEGRLICLTMRRALGREPSASTLGAMEKFLFVQRASFGFDGKPEDFASQIMSIIGARNQLGAPDSVLIGTMDLVAKCNSGTQGRVSVAELASNMLAAGEAASKLSDDGFLSTCAVIGAMKR